MSTVRDWRVIKYGRFPARLPFSWTVCVFYLLDRFHAPQWVWGAVGVFVLVLWVGCICGLIMQEEVDVLPPRGERTP